LTQDFLKLIAKLRADPFRDSDGYPHRLKYDKSRVNIEVILGFSVVRDYEMDIHGTAQRLKLRPPDAPKAPVYFASCDPQPENAKKEGSSYEACKAVTRFLKDRILPLARKYFPEIPESRVVDKPPLKLDSCARHLRVIGDNRTETICREPPKKK
jgi:hypothetical protein